MGNDVTKELVYSKFERYADMRVIENDCISLSCRLLPTLQTLFIRDEKYREKVIECSNLLENLALILRSEANELVDKEVEKMQSFTRYDDKSIIDAHLPQTCKCCGATINPGDLIFVNTEYEFMHAFCSMDCACISCGFHSLANMTKIRRLSPDMSKYWMYFKGKPEQCHCKECEENEN